jgi:hypothetical protein
MSKGEFVNLERAVTQAEVNNDGGGDGTPLRRPRQRERLLARAVP